MTDNKVKHVVEALRLSAPWALLAHFDNLSHCIEASVCGTEILRRYGVDAKCIPCSVIAHRSGEIVSAGLSEETIKRRFSNQGAGIVLEKPTFHCAIEVEEGMVLDLTLGQICAYGVDVPATFLAERAFSCQFTTPNGWRFTYEPETWTPDELKQFEECSHTGLTEDLAELVKLALKAGDLFYDVLYATSPPDVFGNAFQRIMELRRKGGIR